MVQEPARTPGKAEGVDRPEDLDEENEPGRTPDQAEGVDPQGQKRSRRHLKQAMKHDDHSREAHSRDKTGE